MGIDSIQLCWDYFKLYYNKITLLTFLKPIAETHVANSKKNIEYEISKERDKNHGIS